MLWITIDKSRKVPITSQIYGQIRGKILCGELKAGDQLPSTREMAVSLHVSRNVTMEAYQMLFAEGYLVSKPNIGTYVAEGAVLEDMEAPVQIPAHTDFTQTRETGCGSIDFRSGIPALDHIPRKRLAQIKSSILLDSPEGDFGYGAPEGRPELRNAICGYLRRTRGVNCHPDQIVITSGSNQSLSILAEMLLKENSSYIIEDPTHAKIREIFVAAGASAIPVQVDDLGILTRKLPVEGSPRLIFVTPSHQYPLGGNLPVQRRIELIQYARLKGSYIIEDDYDSEFHYEGPQISSMQGLDSDRVIYAGTFSKVLYPSVRLGYVVLPWPLVIQFRRHKNCSDYYTSVLEQLAMERFIEERLLERHIGRMRKIYNNRRDTLIDCLNREFSGKINIKGKSTGLHLIAEFYGVEFNTGLVEFLAQRSIIVHPVYLHSYNGGFPRNLIIMGYGHLNPDSIKKGVMLLKEGLIAASVI